MYLMQAGIKGNIYDLIPLFFTIVRERVESIQMSQRFFFLFTTMKSFYN